MMLCVLWDRQACPTAATLALAVAAALLARCSRCLGCWAQPSHWRAGSARRMARLLGSFEEFAV